MELEAKIETKKKEKKKDEDKSQKPELKQPKITEMLTSMSDEDILILETKFNEIHRRVDAKPVQPKPNENSKPRSGEN